LNNRVISFLSLAFEQLYLFYKSSCTFFLFNIKCRQNSGFHFVYVLVWRTVAGTKRSRRTVFCAAALKIEFVLL